MEDKNTFHHFEHEGWQKAADQYGPGFGGLTSQAILPLLNAVGAREGMRLLDVACGPGYVASAAARLGCSAIGIDFSESMIALARQNDPAVDFREGDAEHLEYPDDFFEAVAMNFGMLHLAHPDRAIAEAFRVLRIGGRLAFTVWDSPPRTAGFQIVLDAVERHGNMKVPLPEGPPFFRFSNVEESARSLEIAGFEKIESITVPMVWTLKTGNELFETMRRAAVRTAALLNMQTADALASIEKEISTRAESYRKSGGIELPMPAILTCGAKLRID